MRGAIKRAAVLAGVAMLTQACATMDPSSSGQSVASAPSYGISGVDNYLRVEWKAEERRGQPIVSGYVTNNWGLGMRKVRLRVEALDTAGSVTATYIGYVNGEVNSGSHVYYEVPVREKAPSYRVRVLSFDPVQGHG